MSLYGKSFSSKKYKCRECKETCTSGFGFIDDTFLCHKCADKSGIEYESNQRNRGKMSNGVEEELDIGPSEIWEISKQRIFEDLSREANENFKELMKNRPYKEMKVSKKSKKVEDIMQAIWDLANKISHNDVGIESIKIKDESFHEIEHLFREYCTIHQYSSSVNIEQPSGKIRVFGILIEQGYK